MPATLAIIRCYILCVDNTKFYYIKPIPYDTAAPNVCNIFIHGAHFTIKSRPRTRDNNKWSTG